MREWNKYKAYIYDDIIKAINRLDPQDVARYMSLDGNKIAYSIYPTGLPASIHRDVMYVVSPDDREGVQKLLCEMRGMSRIRALQWMTKKLLALKDTPMCFLGDGCIVRSFNIGLGSDWRRFQLEVYHLLMKDDNEFVRFSVKNL